jgi:hypothetical protein
MGKIDDMRRLREQQFAESQQRRPKPKPPEAIAPAPVAVVAMPAQASSRGDKEAELAQPTRPTRPTAQKKTTSSKSGGAVDEQGKCPECGKMKPVSNGLMAQHQKGFGKACAGSRKKPA